MSDFSVVIIIVIAIGAGWLFIHGIRKYKRTHYTDDTYPPSNSTIPGQSSSGSPSERTPKYWEEIPANAPLATLIAEYGNGHTGVRLVLASNDEWVPIYTKNKHCIGCQLFQNGYVIIHYTLSGRACLSEFDVFSGAFDYYMKMVNLIKTSI